MSVQEFRLPDPGEGLTEAEIVSWKVQPGDTVKVNDIIVEIETAKSLVELPVPFAGVVSALLVAEGQTVEVGTVIIAVDDGAGGPAAPASTLATEAAPAAPAPSPASAAAPGSSASPPATPAPDQIEEGKIGGTTSTGRTAVLVGYGVKQTEAKRRPRHAAPAPAATVPEVTTQPSAGAPELVAAAATRHVDAGPALPATSAPAADAQPPAAPRPLAKPPVRKYAKDRGVDLAEVAGSGADGVVTREDIDAHLAGGPALAPEVSEAAYGMAVRAPSGERETREPIKGVRKMMAAAMVGSAFTAPHVTELITVDVSATMELVERLKRDRELKDVKVTPLLVLAKAMCLALRRSPLINATWDEAAQEVVVKHYVNLGIAAATPRGLVVPNIKDADQMGMRELGEAIAALTATAREGRTPPADMAGGTITITNVGVFGVDTGTPIINPGESAILAFGAVRRMPWVVTGADGLESIEPRWVTQLALSFDHRLVDGALGSRFIADIAAILHDPGMALVWG